MTQAVLSTTLQRLFPHAAVVAEMSGFGDPMLLYPAEAAHLGKSVTKRKKEFAAGRLCARLALAQLGITDFPISVAPDRQPLWPCAMIGSITHTEGFCAAVVAPRRQVRAVGIDTETIGHVTDELWRSICVKREIDWLYSLPQVERAAAATLIFCAKEAFYKCQYPSVAERVQFHDVAIETREISSAGDFRVIPLKALAFATQAPMPLQGRYVRHADYLSAGVAVGAPPKIG